MLNKIILVFKTHFDIGFTDLSRNVIRDYSGNMLDQVIETCRATGHMGKLRYVWTMPAWPLYHMVRHCEGGRKEELERLIREEQICWHALPYTSHTDFLSAEEYAEGFRYAKELSEQYGKPYPIAAKMTDVPGHGKLLVQTLAEAGVQFLHLGCNEFSTPPRVPELFFWRSAGGKEILTMYSKGGYGTGLFPPEGWKYPVWMALMHTHDNCGPQSADMIQKMVEQIREKYPEAEIVCGTMDDFYRELIQYPLDTVPVITKDLADTWIHGTGSYPAEVSLIRRDREQMKKQSAWYYQQRMNHLDIPREYEVKREQYFDCVGLFGEHTWGADVKTWLDPRRVYKKEEFEQARKTPEYKFMEESWEEQRKRARKSGEICGEMTRLLCGREGERHFLFNPFSHTFSGWVPLSREYEKQKVLLDNREALTEWIGDKWCCYAEGMPPAAQWEIRANGEAEQTDSDASVSVLENKRYRIVCDMERGSVLSVYDKQMKTDLLKAEDGGSCIWYQYDRYGYDEINEFLRNYGYHFTTWGIQDFGRENYPFCSRKTYYPVCKKAEKQGSSILFFYENGQSAEKYGDGEKIILTVTLPQAGEEIYVSVKVQGKEATPYVESGSLGFRFNPKLEKVRIQKTGGMLDTDTDIAEDANHVFYCLDHGMLLESQKVGAALISRDANLAAEGETGIYQYRRKWTKMGSSIYMNLYNNMWGTNFPQWFEGDFSYEFVLFGYEKGEKEAAVWRMDEVAEGLLQTSGGNQMKPYQIPEGMQVAAAFESSDGVILRLREQQGRKESRKLEAEGWEICRMDLFGRTMGQTGSGSLTFETIPYGIHSFLLKGAEKG